MEEEKCPHCSIRKKNRSREEQDALIMRLRRAEGQIRGIQKMVEENVEKYGDPMGKCNTPENREKAIKNLKLTYIFQSIKENISKLSGREVLDFNQYFDLILCTYSGISGALRHLKKVIEILPELKKTDGKQPWLYAVDVFETDTNRARYTCD